MSAKLFFERFWEGDQQNELFVCMPFHDGFDARFNDIIVPAAKERFKESKNKSIDAQT